MVLCRRFGEKEALCNTGVLLGREKGCPEKVGLVFQKRIRKPLRIRHLISPLLIRYRIITGNITSETCTDRSTTAAKAEIVGAPGGPVLEPREQRLRLAHIVE